jgi:hypothetical protein
MKEPPSPPVRWAAVLFWAIAAPGLCGASRIRHAASPNDTVVPEIVVPGEWLTDEKDSFLFLPLDVPRYIQPDQCKIMSNGDSLLVIVTEKPQDEPETNAVKKYKLIMEAIKDEARENESLLVSKLHTWLDTEDDDEVSVLIRSALDSLAQVHLAKNNTKPRAMSVKLGPLGLLEEAATEVASGDNPILKRELTRALPALRRLARHSGSDAGTVRREKESGTLQQKVIKESFAVQIPYPVPKEQVFVLKTRPTMLVVGMPLLRQSLEAKGVSTGGKPFARVPMFGEEGLLAGPAADMKQLMNGIDLPSLARQAGLRPLTDAKL